MSIKTLSINIEDMVCASCEKVITKALKKLPGVTDVNANYTKGTVSLKYDHNLCTYSDIINTINKSGYSVAKDSSKKNESEIFSIVAIIIVALLIIKLGSNSGAFNMDSVLSSKVGYVTLFIVGLFTSIHCVGMCGGIMLSQSITIGNKTPKGKAIPSLLYNLGRLTSYTILGGFIGAIGGVISLSITAQAIISLIAAIFMVIMGLNMFGFKALRRFSIKLPFTSSCKSSTSSKRPFVVGLLNGFMPCGPLQTMQLYALASGSAIAGATSMFFFALGTIPLMLIFGLAANLISQNNSKKLIKISGLIVILLGLIMANRGLNLMGIRLSPTSLVSGKNTITNTSETPGVAMISNGKQKVWISATASGYSPSVVYVQKGIPTEFIVKGDTLTSCNNEIVIPSLNMRKKLSSGDTVFEFTPDDKDINYSCWMGMLNGTIKVVDDLNTVDTTQFNNLAPSTNSDILPGGCCAPRN